MERERRDGFWRNAFLKLLIGQLREFNAIDTKHWSFSRTSSRAHPFSLLLKEELPHKDFVAICNEVPSDVLNESALQLARMQQFNALKVLAHQGVVKPTHLIISEVKKSLGKKPKKRADIGTQCMAGELLRTWPNLKIRWQTTDVLKKCAQADDLETVNYLLESGVKASLATNLSMRMFELLVTEMKKNKLNLNAPITSAGTTPLMSVIREGQIDRIRILLKNGADVYKVKWKRNESAVDVAERFKNKSPKAKRGNILKVIMCWYLLEKMDMSKWTALAIVEYWLGEDWTHFEMPVEKISSTSKRSYIDMESCWFPSWKRPNWPKKSK